MTKLIYKCDEVIKRWDSSADNGQGGTGAFRYTAKFSFQSLIPAPGVSMPEPVHNFEMTTPDPNAFVPDQVYSFDFSVSES